MQHPYPHPEVDNFAPNGYSVHWQPIAPPQARTAPLLWLKLTLAILGVSALSFAIGYWVNAAHASAKLEAAQATLTEAQQIKATATGEIDRLQAEVQEKNTRIKLANDCLYRAFQEPLPVTSGATP